MCGVSSRVVVKAVARDSASYNGVLLLFDVLFNNAERRAATTDDAV
jgi:hypothetical protein